MHDAGMPIKLEAGMAKYFAVEASLRACNHAIEILGGYGYLRDFPVERYFREMMATQLAPVSREMILCHIAERELGLPKSY